VQCMVWHMAWGRSVVGTRHGGAVGVAWPIRWGGGRTGRRAAKVGWDGPAGYAGLVRLVCWGSWATKSFSPEAIQRKERFFLFYLDSIQTDSI
jgi:hypothetical protein